MNEISIPDPKIKNETLTTLSWISYPPYTNPNFHTIKEEEEESNLSIYVTCNLFYKNVVNFVFKLACIEPRIV